MQTEERWPFGVYGRTSADDPKRVTIEIQQKVLRAWGETDPQAQVVDQYWDDGVSGKLPLWERPQGKRLLADVQSGRLKGVAVAYADRFGRTLLDGLQAAKLLEDAGVKLVAVQDGWDSRRNDSPLYFQFRMMVAEEDHRRIVERMTNGKLRAMDRDNAPPGGLLTFGYEIDRDGKFILSETEAPVVLRIFQMYLEGSSQIDILRWVKSTGVPGGSKAQKRTPGSRPTVQKQHIGSQWFLSAISRILRNRTYLGERKWGKRIFPCTPLIDPKSFQKIQDRLAQRNKHCDTKINPDLCLLSGLFRCGICGAVFHRGNRKNTRKSGKVDVYHVYMCDNARPPSGSGIPYCRAKAIPVDSLDAQVWAVCEELLTDPTALVKRIVQADAKLSGVDADLRQQEADLVAKMQALDEEARSVWTEQQAHGWPIAWAAPTLDALKSKRKTASDQLDSIRKQAAAVNATRGDSSAVLAELARLKANMANGPTNAAKLEFIRLIWGSGTVHTIHCKPVKTARVEIELKWGELVCQGLPHQCSSGSERDTRIRLTIALEQERVA